MVSIENIDLFRSWLIKHLQPVCDADPNALAKYVIALVKKDKPENELKELCTEQLEVFLKKETENFVDDLFKSLRSKLYMQDQTEQPTIEIKIEKDKIKQEGKSVSSGKMRRSRSPLSRREVRHRSPSNHDVMQRRRLQDVDHRFSRSRRSPDNRRYVSSGRRRSPNSPVGRRRPRSSVSPPYHHRNSRNNNRYRISSPSSGRKSRSPINNRRQQRSRSISHDSRRGISPTSTKNGGNAKKSTTKCFDYNEKGFCVRGELCPYDHGTDAIAVEDPGTFDNNNNNENDENNGADKNNQKVQVKVETTGGIGIPHHGIIPIPPPNLLAGPPPPLPILPHMRFPPPPHLNIPPRLLQHPPPALPAAAPVPYNPELPSLRKEELSMLPTVTVQMGNIRKRIVNDTMTQSSHSQQLRHSGGPPPNKRPYYNTRRILLICNIPAVYNNISKLNEHFARFGAINNIQVKFDAKPDQAIVEFAHNNSAKAAFYDTQAVFNNRFIRVFWFDPEKSTTKYISSAVVSSNTSLDQQQQPSVKDRLGTIHKTSTQSAQGGNNDDNDKNDGEDGVIKRQIENPDATGPQTPPKTPTTPAVATPSAEELAKQKEELLKQQNDARMKVLAARKEMQRKSKLRQNEAVLKQMKIQLRSQQLLQEFLKRQKDLATKVNQNPTMPAKEVTKIKKMLEDLEKNIQTIRKLKKKTIQPTSMLQHKHHNETTNAVAMSNNRQQLQVARKEMLDTELDLYNAQSTSASSNIVDQNKLMLRKKLHKLQIEAGGGVPSSGGYRGGIYSRGGGRGSRGRGRGGGNYRFIRSGVNLDRRTSQILVRGFDIDDKDDVLAHFSEFGEMDNINFNETTKSYYLKFVKRSDAEQAFLNGKIFKNTTLEVNWWNCKQPTTTTATPTTSTSVTPNQPSSTISTTSSIINKQPQQQITETEGTSSKSMTSQSDDVTTTTTDDQVKTDGDVTTQAQQGGGDDDDDDVVVEIEPLPQPTQQPQYPGLSPNGSVVANLLDDDHDIDGMDGERVDDYGYDLNEFLNDEDVLDEEELLQGGDDGDDTWPPNRH